MRQLISKALTRESVSGRGGSGVFAGIVPPKQRSKDREEARVSLDSHAHGCGRLEPLRDPCGHGIGSLWNWHGDCIRWAALCAVTIDACHIVVVCSPGLDQAINVDRFTV